MAEQASSTVIGKVVDSLFGVIKKETGYMWNCSQHVEKFKNEVEKLQDMKEKVQQQIDIAKVEGNNLIVGVEKWVEEAGQEISKAQEFLHQEANAKKTCFKIGICGNWATLHRYGKITTTKMTPCVLEHQERGKDFVTCVSVYTRAPGPLDVYQNKDLDDIVTQNSALNNIIKALEDDNVQIIGIYGLGGVGKTTLAKEVAARVKTNMMFVDVAFTTVTQTVKAQEIKNDLEIAKKRIEKGEKVLIILDDVWEKLDLEELCIPINHTNCKLLLTSRSEKVCEKMNAQSKIYVDSLPAKEAWILFKRVVGERLETDSNLKPIALKVAQECGGLPLLIQAVGNALKNESMESWKWALSQLQKHAPLDIDDEIRKAFTHLQLSYEYLKSQEAKSCFLICSLFPEDEDIELENLVRYGVGLEKFDDLDSIEDARGRVQNAVNILTSSGLLLHTQQEGFTKMHDVVRDVALLIASQGENKYLVKAGKGLREWLPRENSLNDYTGISLMKNRLSKLPDYKIDLPRLEIFAINDNNYTLSISNELIEGMKEVKVLDMRRCCYMKLPQSFKLLTKLHMLNLEKMEYLYDISMLREMKDLEILLLNGTKIKKIPQEIGQLVNLRQLDVTDCEHLYRITPGVISKLWRLEELCIDFRQVDRGVYDCVVEVMKLSKLTYLVLKVLSFENDIPHQGFSYAKLKGFVIQIGEFHQILEATTRSDRYLVLSCEILRDPLSKWIKELIEESHPRIFFQSIRMLYDIVPTLSGFDKVKDIRLANCRDVFYLLDSTSDDWDEKKTPSEKYFMQLQQLRLSDLKWLMVLWKCPDEYISLTNLVNLSISYCKRLVRVLTVGIAQGLVNLKKLKIIGCFRLEEVIRGDAEEIDRGRGGETEEIVEQQHSSTNIVILFPSLVKITLFNCNRLKSFFNSAGNGNCSIKYPSLVDVRIEVCRSMKKWGPGIHETPKLKRLAGYYRVSYKPILLDGPCAINDVVEKNWSKWSRF